MADKEKVIAYCDVVKDKTGVIKAMLDAISSTVDTKTQLGTELSMAYAGLGSICVGVDRIIELANEGIGL